MILETIPVLTGTDDEAIFNKRHLKPLSDPALNMKKKFFSPNSVTYLQFDRITTNSYHSPFIFICARLYHG